MEANPESIFEELVEENITVCSRCFKKTTASHLSKSSGQQPDCGEKCGTSAVSLESHPLSEDKLNFRGRNLLSLIVESEYDIDRSDFIEALTDVSGKNLSPKDAMVKCISYGIGEKDVENLRDSTQSPEAHAPGEDEMNTEDWLKREGPTSSLDLEDVKIEDSSKVATVKKPSGGEIYYLENTHSPSQVVKSLLDEDEKYLWNGSTSRISSWLTDIDAEMAGRVVPIFVSRINSGGVRRTTKQERYDHFEHSSLSAAMKGTTKEIMASLRKSDKPQSVSEIAEELNLSEETTECLLFTLENRESVIRIRGSESKQKWTTPKDPQ